MLNACPAVRSECLGVGGQVLKKQTNKQKNAGTPVSYNNQQALSRDIDYLIVS